MSAVFPKDGTVHTWLSTSMNPFSVKKIRVFTPMRNSIRSSLEASKSKLINAEKRVLRVQFNERGNIHDIMKLLDEIDFHEVYLRIKLLIAKHICYDLPYIFQSKCLTVLHLTDCGLDKNLLLCHEGIIVPSLQELKLENVILCEDILFKFINKFPNITELSLVNCWRISFIVLTKLDCLKKLYVNLNDFHSFTNIQVVAPRLQVFHFVLRSYESKNVPVNMDIRACKMLREFHLYCWKFPKGLDPEKLCSDFPHLETLLLGPCQTEKSIKISSSSLRKWILSFPQVYECLRTPNLSSFQYKGTTFQPYLAPPSDTSKVLESSYNIVLLPKIHEIIKRAWFLKLRSHLENFSNYDTTLGLCIHEEEISKKLYGRGDRNCCSGTQDKCWRHFLKHFEVKEEKKGQWNALSYSYPRPGKVKEDSDEKDKSTKLIFVFTWKFNS